MADKIEFGKFVRDSAGIRATMNEWGGPVADLGSKVAALAGGDMILVTTDRPAAIVGGVTIAEQARDGRLTRAASAAGLEVKPRKSGRSR